MQYKVCWHSSDQNFKQIVHKICYLPSEQLWSWLDWRKRSRDVAPLLGKIQKEYFIIQYRWVCRRQRQSCSITFTTFFPFKHRSLPHHDGLGMLWKVFLRENIKLSISKFEHSSLNVPWMFLKILSRLAAWYGTVWDLLSNPLWISKCMIHSKIASVKLTQSVKFNTRRVFICVHSFQCSFNTCTSANIFGVISTL